MQTEDYDFLGEYRNIYSLYRVLTIYKLDYLGYCTPVGLNINVSPVCG